MDIGNKPWSEVFKEAADIWCELESAASLLEDTKSAIMAQMQTKVGADLPINRSEQLVKSSPEWTDHVEKIVEARKAANMAKVNLEYIRMKFTEWNNEEANHRAEARL